MSRLHRFTWYELYTTDVEAAKQFYGKVVGWGTQTFERGVDRTMWTGAAGPIGGLMALPEVAKAAGAPPHWLGYVAVQSAADAAGRVAALGGKVIVPPTEIMPGASFAIFDDPQGAGFGVYQSGHGNEPERELGLGDFSWAELSTKDPEAGFAFYADLFGWVKTESMDMGAMGSYQMFGRSKEEGSMGGIMGLPPGMPVSAWIHYANVTDADEVVRKVADLGGKVLYPPMDVPGGGRVTAGMDPQGAVFAVFAKPPAATK